MHAEAPRGAEGPLVLVVDDQPFFRAHLRNELARRGHTVVTAHDAREAEQLVDELGPPLVVVLDLMLPGTSGPELLHLLALRPDADDLRFILVSAHPVLEKVAPRHRLVVARLPKPVDVAVLAAEVDAAGTALRQSER
jgi:CheY-like chemotaxis protein